jgi:hypothetical protein
MTDQTHSEDRYIVVGVDSSPGSRTALRWALTQARLTDAAVEAVAAWQQPATYDHSYESVPFPSPGDSIAATAEKVLSRAPPQLSPPQGGVLPGTTVAPYDFTWTFDLSPVSATTARQQ